ncbi:dihydrolipoyl dehydrogenase [Ectothiorhodospira mobilis]|uniref:dihydrolipoyl dehydrogenase n=1 Tax=Ectothiorhodospira mobilis TaxID=195064 RepID=UPI001EE941C1|nr:dihydrolipoyl dehydrogenase [Ectothiorhodospira mobilis]MCG5536029.1 dihydrolipoyl dehydrogenase [Ectothiorhodospira mobilis]
MAEQSFDVIVIGAGPAGYVAAIRCAQLGLKTACIDRWRDDAGKERLGGTCLNVGCIPSKALLESSELYEHASKHLQTHGVRCGSVELDLGDMMARKDRLVNHLTQGIQGLFKANQVTWFQGHGQLKGERQVGFTAHDGQEETLSAQHIILAPGSAPVELGSAPFDGEYIVDSTGALAFGEVPARLGVIGAGVIGLELGSVWRRLGSEVVMLEAQERFLSFCDEQVAGESLKIFGKQGMDIRLSTRVTSARVDRDAGNVSVVYEDGEGEHEERFDRLVVCVGRRPCTDGLVNGPVELAMDERGAIHVDEYCQTTVPGVYAVGDAVRGPMLAHKGSEEGVMVAERIAGMETTVNYDTIPNVIYTLPEIAWVGRTEQDLKKQGIPYATGVFPFVASGRARAMEDTTGFVKLLAHAETDRLLGAHIISSRASELIAECAIAIEFGASSEDLARTVFAHPTLSEAVHEAALATLGHPLHIPPKGKRG